MALVDFNYTGDILYYIRCLGTGHFDCFDISHNQSILQAFTSPAVYIMLYQNLCLVPFLSL